MSRDIGKCRMWLNGKMHYSWLEQDLTDWLSPHTPDGGILMLYTGLQDSTKREIYEGDIIKHNDKRFVVKYSESQFVLLLKEVGSKTNWRDLEWCNNVRKYIEIEGNIYENKKLLK